MIHIERRSGHWVTFTAYGHHPTTATELELFKMIEKMRTTLRVIATWAAVPPVDVKLIRMKALEML